MKFCISHPNRRVFSKGLCAECYKRKYSRALKRTPLKRKPYFIRTISKKRAKQNTKYQSLKLEFLELHPFCEIKKANCTIKATEIHHMEGRENELLLDVSKWKAICHSCHLHITENSKEAIEKGYSQSRHKI